MKGWCHTPRGALGPMISFPSTDLLHTGQIGLQKYNAGNAICVYQSNVSSKGSKERRREKRKETMEDVIEAGKEGGREREDREKVENNYREAKSSLTIRSIRFHFLQENKPILAN